jgi:hypothetical protein
LNKKHVEEFIEMYVKSNPEMESKILQLLVKDLRLVEPLDWILGFLPGLINTPTTRNENANCIEDVVGNKNLKMTYTDYSTPV